MMASKPRNSDLPLLCALGIHSPRAMAHWNHGYYFSRCRRCDTDLVRTAYSAWHVPRGHRVVWQSTPPASHVEVELALDESSVLEAGGGASADRPAPEAPPPAGAEIEDRSGSSEQAVTAPDPPGPDQDAGGEAPPVRDRPLRGAAAMSAVPDFMSDGLDGRAIRPGQEEHPPLAADPGDATADPSGASWLHRLTYRPDAANEQRSSAKARRLYISFGAFAGFLLLVALVWSLLATRVSPPAETGAPPPDATEAAPTPFAAESGTPAADPAESFVTASLLNCRSAPAVQARSLRRLARGQPVQVLAREAEWASIAVDGEQCWALARYIAAARPIS